MTSSVCLGTSTMQEDNPVFSHGDTQGRMVLFLESRAEREIHIRSKDVSLGILAAIEIPHFLRDFREGSAGRRCSVVVSVVNFLSPAEPAESEDKRNSAPQDQHQQASGLGGQRRAFKDRSSQRVIEGGQGQGFDQRLYDSGEVLVGKEDAREYPHWHHHQVDQ